MAPFETLLAERVCGSLRAAGAWPAEHGQEAESVCRRKSFGVGSEGYVGVAGVGEMSHVGSPERRKSSQTSIAKWLAGLSVRKSSGWAGCSAGHVTVSDETSILAS